MAPVHDPNAQTAIDMASARNASSVDAGKIRNFLHHGEKEWNTRRRIVEIASNDPVFDKSKRDFMNRTERFNRGLALTNRIYQLQEAHGWSKEETSVAFASLDEQLAINLHHIAFEPVFLLQASPSLLSKYAALVATRGILGCYLQTELAHGTNVQSLETTATYLPATQEFEIHSPTLTSTKWWIGGLGKMATHGVVQARLILPDGKDMGPHLFFVQLRSLEDHSPMLGITIGDIGPKAHGGFTATDNGFARFHHVRIPKEHMLSKFAQVTDDGRYVQPPHAKLSYGGMLYIRSGMVTAAGWQTAKAATISIRYATVRRQGEREKGPQEIDSGLERQIITYPSVYTRLLPILSRAYVFIKLGKILTTLFATFQTQLSTNNLNASFLGELHALTSGLKVLCTTLGVNDIEQARRSMGGHGYSAFAGLGRVYADFLPSVTYEGDNFVLDQQVVRAALKAYKALFASFSHPHLSSHGYGPSQSRDSQLPPSSAYLRLLIPTQCPALIGAGGSSSVSPLPPPLVQRGFRNTPVDWMDYQNVVLILEWRAAVLVQNHASSSASAGTTVDLDPSVNQRVSRAVTEAFVASKVGEMIEGLTAGSGGKGKYIQEFVFAEEDARVLKDLYLLYLLTTAEAALTDLLTFSLLSPPPNPSPTPLPFPSPSYTDPTIPLRTALSRLSHSLLPHLIRLTDSFGFTDWELDSALGVYDGRVYERLVERAAREPLNDGGERRGYEESIKPILERGQRQARELGEAMRAGKGGAKL